MFGFVIGALCLVGLLKVSRAGRHWEGGRWGGRRQRWMFRWLFERLETTPGQEKVIVEAVEQVRDAAAKASGTVRGFGPDVARAMRGQTLDHEQLKQAFLKQDAELEELRRAVLVSLEKVHEALDERQRRELAELIERAPMFGGGGWHGHHRCGHHGLHGRRYGRGPMSDASMV